MKEKIPKNKKKLGKMEKDEDEDNDEDEEDKNEGSPKQTKTIPKKAGSEPPKEVKKLKAEIKFPAKKDISEPVPTNRTTGKDTSPLQPPPIPPPPPPDLSLAKQDDAFDQLKGEAEGTSNVPAFPDDINPFGGVADTDPFATDGDVFGSSSFGGGAETDPMSGWGSFGKSDEESNKPPPTSSSSFSWGNNENANENAINDDWRNAGNPDSWARDDSSRDDAGTFGSFAWTGSNEDKPWPDDSHLPPVFRNYQQGEMYPSDYNFGNLPQLQKDEDDDDDDDAPLPQIEEGQEEPEVDDYLAPRDADKFATSSAEATIDSAEATRERRLHITQKETDDEEKPLKSKILDLSPPEK